MAFPSIRSSNTTNGTGATTTPVVNLPATIHAGDTLIVYFRCAVAGAIGWPSAEWHELVDASPDGADDQIGIAWKKADGTEGATITLSSGNGKFAAIARAIQDATDPSIRAPELSTVAIGTSAGEPNATTCTPTGGAKDYLWDAVYFMEGEQTGITANPASHTLDQRFANSGTAGAVTTNCTIGAVGRQLNAASLDVAAWDVAGTLDDWSAYTVAFHPAEAVPAPLQTEIDRPNPQPWRYQNVGFVAASALALLTFVPTPFAQNDWPTPQPLPQRLIVTIETRPAEDGQPPIVPPQGWEVPRVAVRRMIDTSPPNLLTSTLFDAGEEAPTPFTPPLWEVPRRSPRALIDASIVNLLTSTLADTAEAAPFAQTHWPLPSTRAPLRLTITDQRRPYLVDQTPANQYDWPLPQRAPIPIWPHRVHTTKAMAADATPPFVAEALELPRPRLTSIAWRLDWLQNLLEGTLAVPVRPIEWPLPRRATPTHALSWTHTSLNVSTLAMPFAQLDWPLPRRSASTLPDGSIAPARVLDQAPTPFTQSEWPLAQRKPQVSQPPPISSQPWLLTTPPPAPAQTDWPLPIRAKGTALTWLGSNILPLTTAPNPKPFSQTDWPLPRVATPAIALRTWTDTREPHLVDQSPIRQLEWPLPRVAKAPSLTTFTPSTLVTTLAVPFAQAHWPLPPVATRQALTWTQPAIVTTLTPIPAAQTEWPNPRVTRWTDRTWTQPAITATAPPFAQYTWPTPSRLTRLIVDGTRGFTPTADAPFSQQSWPVPTVGRRALLDWLQRAILTVEAPEPPVEDVEPVEPTLFGDAGTVKQAIATLLTGLDFEHALRALEQRFADGVVLERLTPSCVKTAELVGVPAQFPWVEIVLEVTEPDVEVDYADKNSHELAIIVWANGDTESVVAQRLERYLLAIRSVLRNETLMPMISCLPVVRVVEEYGVVGKRKNVTSPFVKAAAITFVVTTIE